MGIRSAISSTTAFHAGWRPAMVLQGGAAGSRGQQPRQTGCRGRRGYSAADRGPPLGGELEQGQAEQGMGAVLINVPARRNCPAGSSSCHGDRAAATREANSTSATTPRPGGGRRSRECRSGRVRRWGARQNSAAQRRAGMAAHGGHKKAPPMAGPEGHIRAAIKPGAE